MMVWPKGNNENNQFMKYGIEIYTKIIFFFYFVLVISKKIIKKKHKTKMFSSYLFT